MQKLEDVVIPMRQKLSRVKLLSGTNDFALLQNQKVLPPFDNLILNFLVRLSKVLFESKEAQKFSDIVAFAFFCRKANLNSIEKKYNDISDSSLGKGIIFHVTPSNVPINFAYSLIMGLLAGNICIVKVSSKEFPQTEIVCNAINLVLKDKGFEFLNKFLSIIQYNNDDFLNSFFSELCNLRVIWGGDLTINKIRSAKLPSRSTDITFADRFSGCIVNAKKYLEDDNKSIIAQSFYNDTYLFDQNACSSPSFIYWLGTKDEINFAKTFFWKELQLILIKKKYEVQPMIASEKLMTAYRAAIEMDGVSSRVIDSNLIFRFNLNKLPRNLHSFKQSGGFFYEFSSENIEDLFEQMSTKFQTLTYIGFDGSILKNKILDAGVQGVDRIVRCGDSMTFNPIWDGVDLIRQMSRIIDYR
jgi:hypothetical protein